jgi:hypothetical protein
VIVYQALVCRDECTNLQQMLLQIILFL